MKRKPLLALLLLALILPPLAARPVQAQAGPAAEVLSLVNALRASHGLPAFSPDPSLMAAAQSHTDWMAANNTYTHSGAGGSSPQSRAAAAGYQGWVAENIVGGTNLSPQQGVIWWENSPVHYATLISSRHVSVGVGFASSGAQNIYTLLAGYPSGYAPSVGGQNQNNNNTAPDAPTQAQYAPVVITPVEVAAPREDGSVVHVVQIGQTAWDIAAAYGVDLGDVLAFNYLPSDNPIILPGDEIIVRLSDQPTPAPQGPLLHVVQAGQSAWSIALRYHIELADLLRLNNLPQEPVLQPGQELLIRLAEGQPSPTPISSYVVQEGDALYGIADHYGLTLEQLLDLNGLDADYVIHPGEELWVRPPEATPTLPLPPAISEVVDIESPTPSASASGGPTPTEGPVSTHEIAAIAVEVTLSPTPTGTIAATFTPTMTATPRPTPTPLTAAGGEPDPVLVGGVLLAAGIVLIGGVVIAAGLVMARRGG